MEQNACIADHIFDNFSIFNNNKKRINFLNVTFLSIYFCRQIAAIQS